MDFEEAKRGRLMRLSNEWREDEPKRESERVKDFIKDMVKHNAEGEAACKRLIDEKAGEDEEEKGQSLNSCAREMLGRMEEQSAWLKSLSAKYGIEAAEKGEDKGKDAGRDE